MGLVLLSSLALFRHLAFGQWDQGAQGLRGTDQSDLFEKDIE